MLAILTGIALIYRFGPSRRPAKWCWLSWGAGIATVVWVAASWAFSYYLQNFADYNATYGSLGAIIGLMTWTWISVVILIIGAEITPKPNTRRHGTRRSARQKHMGRRGVVVADTVGKSSESKGAARPAG